MATDSKYGQIDIPGIPADEPVFIIRARDVVAPQAIFNYASEATAVGANPQFVASVVVIANAFKAWQNANGCKVPD